MDIKILVADDDTLFRQLICDILKKQNYIPIEAANGKEATDLFFANNDINLVILDVMMPIYNGWEVLEMIRQQSEVPILMLTALGDERDQLNGLSKGADDYIAKPFSYALFTARINALLRKVKKEQMSKVNIGEIEIDLATHKVVIGTEVITLNNKEYNLLLYLIKNKNIVLSRDKILNNVWQYDFEGDIRTIDAHIKMLRSKLLHCNNYIKTVRGSGYIFEVNYEAHN